VTSSAVQPTASCTARPSGISQFISNSIACLCVQELGLFKSGEQLLSLGAVVSVTLELGDDLALPRDVFFAADDMVLSLFQMPFNHCPIHSGSLEHLH
jgi:hypothetical protein